VATPIGRWPLVALALAFALTLPSVLRERELRNDFLVYYYAARVEQQSGNPYDDAQLNQAARADGVDKYIYPYLYPPLLSHLMRPLARFAPLQAQRIWLGCNLVCLALLFVVLARWSVVAAGPPVLPRRAGYAMVAAAMLALFFAVRRDLKMGQINIPVTLLITSALYAIERRRSALGGLLLTLAAALKVLPAVLALLLLARRRTRALLAMAGSAVVIGVGAVAALGRDFGAYRAMSASAGYGRALTTRFGPGFYNNLSLGGFFCRFVGVGSPIVASLAIASLAILVGLGVIFRRALAHPNSPTQGLLYASGLMILASPVVWLHHLVYFLPAACVAIARLTTAASPEERRGARLLLTLMAVSALPFEDLYLRLFDDASPMWTPSVFIPNLPLLLTLMAGAIWTAHRNAAAAALSGARS
jgi:alpha-1,2-mannosyltransferase